MESSFTEALKTPVTFPDKSYKVTKSTFNNIFVQPLISIPTFGPQIDF
jgi:hypothetical protein